MTKHEKALQKLVNQQERLIEHLLARLDLSARPAWGVRLKDVGAPDTETSVTIGNDTRDFLAV